MKKYKYKIFMILAVLFFLAMFLVDNSGAFVDGTKYYIYERALFSVVFATLALNIKSIPKWRNIVIWAVFVLGVLLSVNPAINNRKFKPINNPGVELSNPSALTVIYGDNKIKTKQCAYNWYYDDRLLKETMGFSGWLRIGATVSHTADYKQTTTEAKLNFSNQPDRFEIRYWDKFDWDFPSEVGKKIKTDSSYSFSIQKGYYRVTAYWDDYGYVVYGFIIK